MFLRQYYIHTTDMELIFNIYLTVTNKFPTDISKVGYSL